MRKIRCLWAMLITFALLGAVSVSGGCAAPQDEGFAIYLTKNDVPPEQMEALSHIEIADQPVISQDDIVTYNEQTHELRLTAEAYGRVCNLEVPVRGKSFVVCVDKGPVYWGAFWTPISSISFSGVTIWQPLTSDESRIVTLELGYPSESFYGGEDPRDNQEVISALQKAGKLVTGLSINDISQLPASMKGYELYSWQDGGNWRFTLITGTDRNKTLEEITSGDDFISETGWIKASVTGAEALNDVFCKIPADSFVIWLGQFNEPGQQAGSGIQLPPQDIIDNISAQAEGCGLDFSVAGS
jgi:hypothetical protein